MSDDLVKLLVDIRRDMEAGTPGPWEYFENVSPSGEEWLGSGVAPKGGLDFVWFEQHPELRIPDARRIARVPALEQTVLNQADRIEQLEADLAKAVGALNEIADTEPDPDNMGRFHDIANAAIAEIGDIK